METTKTKLKWKCSQGHIWDTTPSTVLRGAWCPKCSGVNAQKNNTLTIQEMQEIANSRGGECLSKIYRNANTKLKWKCSEGHIWEAKPTNVKNGTWCKTCKGLDKLSIEDMQFLAQSRRGKCLSKRIFKH